MEAADLSRQAWLFWAVKLGQHRSLGEFCQPAYWHQACPSVQVLVVSVEFGLGCLSISFPLLVNSSLHCVLFCAALQSAPLYCSSLFPPTSSGDSLGCGVFHQRGLWCRAGFCESYCFSLSLMFCSAPQTEKCRWIAFQFREMWLLGCFCFIVSLYISHKLFLPNLVLAWMKPAWKWEQDWNCSNLGKCRRALQMSSLIFLCSLRETQFKLLHSSFVPSTASFRWSGGALVLPRRINVTVFVDHFHCLWACPIIVALHLQLQGFLDEAEKRSFLLSSASWLGERACEDLVVYFHGDKARELFFPLFWCIFVEVWAELLFLLCGTSRGSVFSTVSPSWVVYRCRLGKK